MATVLNLSQAATDEISQALGGKDFIVIAINAGGTKQQFLPAGVQVTPTNAGKTPIDYINIAITPPTPGSPPGLGGVMKTFGWCNIGGIWVPC